DHGCRARRVGPAVDQDPRPNADELPVTIRTVLRPDSRGVAVDVADARLLPGIHELRGPIRVQRQHPAVDLHGQVLAAAERAADAGEMNTDLLLTQTEARGNLVAVDVQPLRRDVDVDAALAVRNGQPRFGPQECLILNPELVIALDGDVARRIRVAALDPHVADAVRPGVVAKAVADGPLLRMDRLLVRRALHVHDRLE